MVRGPLPIHNKCTYAHAQTHTTLVVACIAYVDMVFESSIIRRKSVQRYHLGSTRFTQVDEGRGQNVTYDLQHFENNSEQLLRSLL